MNLVAKTIFFQRENKDNLTLLEICIISTHSPRKYGSSEGGSSVVIKRNHICANFPPSPPLNKSIFIKATRTVFFDKSSLKKLPKLKSNIKSLSAKFRSSTIGSIRTFHENTFFPSEFIARASRVITLSSPLLNRLLSPTQRDPKKTIKIFECWKKSRAEV